MMFTKHDPSGFREAMEGVRFKTLAHGEGTLLAEFLFEPGARVPVHDHPHEQTGYLVSGRLLFEVEGELLEAVPGTGWNIPSGVPHGAEAVEASVVVEVFSPVREDYLP